MRWWRDRWPEYVTRPKVKRLADKEKEKLLATMTRAVAASPVLSHLGVRVRLRRGRFYIEREWKDEEPGIEILGRITPLLAAQGDLLLEAQRRNGSWHEVAKGTAQKLIKVVASDTRGKFHGLGSLDKTLREKGKGLTRLPVKKEGTKFIYGWEQASSSTARCRHAHPPPWQSCCSGRSCRWGRCAEKCPTDAGPK